MEPTCSPIASPLIGCSQIGALLSRKREAAAAAATKRMIIIWIYVVS